MRHNRPVTRDDAATGGPVEHPESGGRTAPESRPADDPSGKRRRGQDFALTGFLRRGYEVSDVETFLHEAERALRSEPPAMAPYEVQDARFRGVRWRRGYDMRAVDDRMEELHLALRERHGDDSVSGIQGHVSVRQHRTAFWIYVAAAVLVVVIVGFAVVQAL
jgi:hypothetical protein